MIRNQISFLEIEATDEISSETSRFFICTFYHQEIREHSRDQLFLVDQSNMHSFFSP